ncbi:uroporphyrinogen-III synthase [Sphingomonas sp. CCH21-G11]|uniref:uroporphyrinogen-III synthase n=1 Tax=Sphingomonas sp. CCH21-G11 TaxID=1768749 RepID=UPI00082CACFC|nr:uroporphyrinogen-III synthase [Sphingomonas sp. CCH21-G11]
MSRPIAVLRPDPGNGRTAAAIEAAGQVAIRLPLFAIRPIDWQPPDAADHDALILTSTNAVRHAGSGLAGRSAYVVGARTAAAARSAGLSVAATGATDAQDLARLVAVAGVCRALHLAGRDHRPLPGEIVTATRIVYASDALTVAPGRLAALNGAVALVHSVRAGARLAELMPPPARAGTAIAAISASAAAAAGSGWCAVAIAARPADADVIAAARALAD